MRNKLLLIFVFSLLLGACSDRKMQNVHGERNIENEPNDYDFDKIEVIVVNKIPRGTFAGETRPKDSYLSGWYDIGLSVNGKEPIEYIWRATGKPFDYAIMNAEIGDKGKICLGYFAKTYEIKLPRPDAKKPPIIGTLGIIYWEKQE